MEETVLSSGLLIQTPALLKLTFTLKELGLSLVFLCLEVNELVLGAIQLSLSLIQLGLGLLELALALLKFSGELFLGGAHGGGDLLRDFEELASGLLQGLQLGRGDRQTRLVLI